MRKIIVLIASIVLFTSCAKNIVVKYQNNPEYMGSIELLPAKNTEKTFVTINDELIVNKKNVKSVLIQNVPEGDYKIHYISENGWYSEKLDTAMMVTMVKDKKITKLIEIPPYSAGYWVFNIFMWVLILGPVFVIPVVSY